jgi:hypothetical protein
MLFRWIDLLMSLKFTVIHWPGVSNQYADAMSRPPIENNYNLIEEHNHAVQSNVISTNTDMIIKSDLVKKEIKKSPDTLKEKERLIIETHAPWK